MFWKEILMRVDYGIDHSYGDWALKRESERVENYIGWMRDSVHLCYVRSEWIFPQLLVVSPNSFMCFATLLMKVEM